MGTTAEAMKKPIRRTHVLYSSPANRNPTAKEDVRYRMPLHASATSHFPVGTEMNRPSSRTGTPQRSSALTANHAEKSDYCGSKHAPKQDEDHANEAELFNHSYCREMRQKPSKAEQQQDRYCPERRRGR